MGALIIGTEILVRWARKIGSGHGENLSSEAAGLPLPVVDRAGSVLESGRA